MSLTNRVLRKQNQKFKDIFDLANKGENIDFQ